MPLRCLIACGRFNGKPENTCGIFAAILVTCCLSLPSAALTRQPAAPYNPANLHTWQEPSHDHRLRWLRSP